MFPELTPIKQPIGIRPELIVDQQTTLRVQQHGKGLSSGRFTILRPDADTDSVAKQFSSAEGSANADTVSPCPVLLYVDGKYGSLESKRSFCDASGLPLFDLYHKFVGVTWYVELPGGASGTPIMRLAPRASSLKDKLEVTVQNAAAGGEEVTLHVEGQDIWKQRTYVYLGDKVVMTAKRTDKWSVYVPGKKLEWAVDVVAGMDVAVASVIVVVLAANMYDSSMQSSSSA
ncbi:hypothetical protein WHR41_06912 [Cladosporium halotolerans]|uniref:Uncharacterized protein n=1 Tax=Cladosporium halotolerans TaxID=1052096 RepID=A0AB34KKV1_9PEZI